MLICKHLLKTAALLGVILVLNSCSDDPTAPEDEDPFNNPPVAGELDPFIQNQRLGRGMNLGNALEAPNEGEWGVVLEDWFFEKIKNAGFHSVRIPVRWSAHAAADPPYALEAMFVDRVKWAVEQALSRELLVVLNIHHYDELIQDPAGEKARFLGIWRNIAAEFKDYPGELIFEVLNEPNGDLNTALWNSYLAEAIAVIRERNPGRTIMVGPANWYSLYYLSNLDLPGDDQNIIVSFHYYNPFQFTHQGAEWVTGSDAWLGTTWIGTMDEQQAVLDDLTFAADWGALHNRPLNIGEFGAYYKADMTSRARWTAFVTSRAEMLDMSWSYWEFIAGFGAYDPAADEWRTPLLNALIPPALP